jgi:hypothetical protein
MTGSGPIDADRAFAKAARARRRAGAVRWLRGEAAERGRLAVFDATERPRAVAEIGRGSREIPLDAIRGTLEPARARLFDRGFRPARSARHRWRSVWLAEHRGTPLPPIAVVPVGDGYAVRDGHHRVSVANARGAIAIDAIIDGVGAPSGCRRTEVA